MSSQTEAVYLQAKYGYFVGKKKRKSKTKKN